MLARIEKQYQDCVKALEERNAALEERNTALVKEGEAADRAECVFVQTHIVPDKVVVLRVGEEKWSGIFKEV